jgi:hypothetical protein
VVEDPDASERLVQKSASLDGLIESSRETADKVLALQQELSELIGREGIEEPLLIVMTQLEVDGSDQPVRPIVPITVDGGSRVTIAQEHLAGAIATLLKEKEPEYSTKHKRRKGLEELERALRAHQPATLIDDTVAERELRDFLVELSSRPAAELVRSRLYPAQRSLVAPAMVVVGFRPNGSATILDAIDQMVANQHKRGPLQWQPAAAALDSRNSVVRSLWRQAKIGEAKAMLLGPRYEEAVKRYGMHPEPDFRVGEAVRIFHGHDARRPIREAYGTSQAKPEDRSEIIAAVIGEQLRSANPALRKQVETALRDILGSPPFYGAGVPELPIGSNPNTDELVGAVKEAENADPDTLSPAHVELGVKGGVALLGALARAHGSITDAPRPYTVLQRMVHDQFGQELLGEAIMVLRAGKDQIPARDAGTKAPKGRDAENRIVPMDPANLRELFPDKSSGGGKGSGEPPRTRDDVLVEMRSVARNNLGRLLDELKELPDVVRQGVTPNKVKDLVDLLMDQAGELDHLGRKGAEYLQASEHDVPRPSEEEGAAA